MKKLLITTVLAGVLSTQAFAAEQGKIYITGSAGYNVGFTALKTTSTNKVTGVTEKNKAELEKIISPYTIASLDSTITTEGKMPRGFGAYTLGIGYNISDQARADLTLNYFSSKGKDSEAMEKVNVAGNTKLSSFGVLANAYYDINANSAVTPYFMVGAGFGKTSLKIDADISNPDNTKKVKATLDSSKYNLLWNVGGGVAFKLDDCFYLDLGYRFANIGATAEKDVTKENYKLPEGIQHNTAIKTGDLYRHTVTAGVRFVF